MFLEIVQESKYREDFCFVDWFHGSVLHGAQCVIDCKAHMNVDKSACPMADNVLNEVVTIHR
jgi:hypothetical protein